MGIDVRSLNIQDLLKQELTRKQFLQLLGVLIVSVLGFDNLIRMLSKAGTPPSTKKTKEPTSNGFGSSKFGV